MFTVLLAILLMTATPPVEALTDRQEAFLIQATRDCPLNRRPDEAFVRRLIVIEAQEGGPEWPTGLLPAAVCQEAAMLPQPACGDGGRSCSCVQLGARLRRGVDWRDCEQAARRWVQHVRLQYERKDWIGSRCRRLNGYESHRDLRWASANLTATWRPPRGGGPRCSQYKSAFKAKKYRHETKHWARLRAWRKALSTTGRN